MLLKLVQFHGINYVSVTVPFMHLVTKITELMWYESCVFLTDMKTKNDFCINFFEKTIAFFFFLLYNECVYAENVYDVFFACKKDM